MAHRVSLFLWYVPGFSLRLMQGPVSMGLKMFTKKLCVSVMATSLILLPVQRVQASDAAKVLGGLILGGIIINEVNKSNKRKQAQQTQQAAPRTTTRTTTGTSSAQREQNRQVQTALNYFGYNVGTVDGSIGRNTRNGIARYQGDMGFQADGRMEQFERDFLVNSYQRALSSSHVAPYNSILATQGQAGLLRTYRNEQLGIATPQVAAAPAPVPVPAPTGVKTVPSRAPTGALPEFTYGQVDKSVNEFCNEINVLTAANGGITTSARVTDAEFALNEQFCLARTHAMAESSQIEATIPNMTSSQIQAQCQGLAQAVAPHMETLSTDRPDQVIADTSLFLQDSGRPLDQLISGGKVCLGVGYRTDDANMALASAVLLAAGGQLGYGEMISHQMREGLGTAQVQPQKAAEWMTLALGAMQGGGATVLGQSADRVAVLNTAMRGGGQTGAAALPVFPSSN